MDVLVTQEKIIKLLSPNSTMLDIGAGKKQRHANWFRKKGLLVDTVDFSKNSTFIGNFNELNIDKQYDCVWASHCLEHQLNVNNFLRKCFSITKEGGYICLTVPPKKDWIVGGHLSLWNAGLLLYNLVMAGFDCKNASIKSYDYNISVITRKKSFTLPKLIFDMGDLRTLNQYMPLGLVYDEHGHFDGNIKEHNWI